MSENHDVEQKFNEVIDKAAEYFFTAFKDMRVWNIDEIRPIVRAQIKFALADIIKIEISQNDKIQKGLKEIIPRDRVIKKEISLMEKDKQSLAMVIALILKTDDWELAKAWLKNNI